MENTSRHLLYLQLRHDLLEGRQLLLSDILLQLAALALQAEFGDRKHQVIQFNLHIVCLQFVSSVKEIGYPLNLIFRDPYLCLKFLSHGFWLVHIQFSVQ